MHKFLQLNYLYIYADIQKTLNHFNYCNLLQLNDYNNAFTYPRIHRDLLINLIKSEFFVCCLSLELLRKGSVYTQCPAGHKYYSCCRAHTLNGLCKHSDLQQKKRSVLGLCGLLCLLITTGGGVIFHSKPDANLVCPTK